MRNFILVIVCLVCGYASAQPVPYNVNRKKFPLGEDFRKLLPEYIGDWSRFAFHDYIPGREQGNVFYQKGDKEIDVVFGKANDQNDLKSIWKKLYDAQSDHSDAHVKEKNLTSPTTKFYLIEGKDYTYSWTRNLYYFSVSARNKTDVDEFMKSFPW